MSKLKELLINNNCVQFMTSAKDWVDALKITAKPLLNHRFIEDRYLSEIISETNKIGGYYVYDDEMIALPHARPECGALKNGASLLVLKEPISFLGGTPVSIILMFCATDAKQHIESGLKQIMELLDDNAKMNAIRESNSLNDLLKIL